MLSGRAVLTTGKYGQRPAPRRLESAEMPFSDHAERHFHLKRRGVAPSIASDPLRGA
jgi:hypothetical protein